MPRISEVQAAARAEPPALHPPDREPEDERGADDDGRREHEAHPPGRAVVGVPCDQDGREHGAGQDGQAGRAQHTGGAGCGGQVVGRAPRPLLAARSASGMIVEVHVADSMPGLPEHVEIAAFRIAEEAMTDVLRHAQASRCEVRLEADGELVVSVRDDGVGLPAQTRPGGIGLTSMRQRATDLGGCCDVGPADPSGVIVLARLPLLPVLT
jgi:hypothetical protein